MAFDPNTTQPDVIKGIFAAFLAVIAMLGFSACGVKAGSFVAGSTSYLREANRSLQIESKLEGDISERREVRK